MVIFIASHERNIYAFVMFSELQLGQWWVENEDVKKLACPWYYDLCCNDWNLKRQEFDVS